MAPKLIACWLVENKCLHFVYWHLCSQDQTVTETPALQLRLFFYCFFIGYSAVKYTVGSRWFSSEDICWFLQFERVIWKCLSLQHHHSPFLLVVYFHAILYAKSSSYIVSQLAFSLLDWNARTERKHSFGNFFPFVATDSYYSGNRPIPIIGTNTGSESLSE